MYRGQKTTFGTGAGGAGSVKHITQLGGDPVATTKVAVPDSTLRLNTVTGAVLCSNLMSVGIGHLRPFKERVRFLIFRGFVSQISAL